MENTEQNPGQEENTLELEQTSEESTNEESQGGDPLDAIEDIETLRAEAKKIRAIGGRKRPAKSETPSKAQIPDDAPKGEFLTRSDYAKIATRDAKKNVGENVAEVWDELVAIPLAGYDPLDADSIAKNMQERYAIYNARSPKKEAKPDTTDLTTTKAVGTGNAPKTKATAKNPPDFKLPSGAADWYK